MSRLIELQKEFDPDMEHYYMVLTMFVNELLRDNKIELKVAGKKVSKLVHKYYLIHCNEIDAITEDGHSYNVGIPFFDKVPEEFLNE